jgi:hypothetical protein
VLLPVLEHCTAAPPCCTSVVSRQADVAAVHLQQPGAQRPYQRIDRCACSPLLALLLQLLLLPHQPLQTLCAMTAPCCASAPACTACPSPVKKPAAAGRCARRATWLIGAGAVEVQVASDVAAHEACNRAGSRWQTVSHWCVQADELDRQRWWC